MSRMQRDYEEKFQGKQKNRGTFSSLNGRSMEQEDRMIEIISTERQKITDQEVTEALQTLRQYCREHEDTGPECQGCCAHVVCGNLAPMDWDLPGDEEAEA